MTKQILFCRTPIKTSIAEYNPTLGQGSYRVSYGKEAIHYKIEYLTILILLLLLLLHVPQKLLPLSVIDYMIPTKILNLFKQLALQHQQNYGMLLLIILMVMR